MANLVKKWLTDKFSAKFIEKFQWSAKSPDLNQCDSYFWGSFKAWVNNPMLKTSDNLGSFIVREINLISKGTLKEVFYVCQ